MLFEARELKPYAETVPTDELEIGEIYFAVDFFDDEMLIPFLEPKVYIGRNLDPEEEDAFYFQDLDSYQAGVRFETAAEDDEVTFETGTERHLFDYESALEVLMSCSLRRREALGQG
jgi:hypothetical protein